MLVVARAWAVVVACGSALMASTGCAPDRGECPAFILCAQDYSMTFGVDEPDTSVYDEDGTCWADPRVAEACRAQCHDTREAYRKVLEETGEDQGRCAGDAEETEG